jgi:hypothetical protein
MAIQSFRTHETTIDETFPEAVCSRDGWTLQADATGSDNTGRYVFERNRQFSIIYCRFDIKLCLTRFSA